MIKIRWNVPEKKNIFVVWFLQLTNIYLIHSSIQIFDLVNIFFCFFKILPLCLHTKKHSENIYRKKTEVFFFFFGQWGEAVLLYFKTLLQLLLQRHNIDNSNHSINLGYQIHFKCILILIKTNRWPKYDRKEFSSQNFYNNCKSQLTKVIVIKSLLKANFNHFPLFLFLLQVPSLFCFSVVFSSIHFMLYLLSISSLYLPVYGD